MEKVENCGQNCKKTKEIMISPSILSADFAFIASALDDISTADMVHCDVMDGIFVPNISFGIKMVADIKKNTTLPLDVHLMIVKPAQYIPQFIKAGADIVTFHIESDVDADEAINLIKNSGVKCGISISPDTPVSAIEKYINRIDLVLLMSVYPGFSGQKFIPSSVQKLRELVALKRKLNPDLIIEIDGGVGEDNIKMLFEEGVDMAVAGNAVFKENPKNAIQNLKNIAKL